MKIIKVLINKVYTKKKFKNNEVIKLSFIYGKLDLNLIFYIDKYIDLERLYIP